MLQQLGVRQRVAGGSGNQSAATQRDRYRDDASLVAEERGDVSGNVSTAPRALRLWQPVESTREGASNGRRRVPARWGQPKHVVLAEVTTKLQAHRPRGNDLSSLSRCPSVGSCTGLRSPQWATTLLGGRSLARRHASASLGDCEQKHAADKHRGDQDDRLRDVIAHLHYR